MALSIGTAVGSGFNLIGRRPLAVIGWGFFVSLAALVFVVLLFVGAGAGTLTQLRPGGDPTAQAQAMARFFATIWPLFLLFIIGLLFVNAMVQGAVFRSVLQPDVRGFASIRLGAEEVQLFLLFLVFFVFAIVCEVASIVVIGIFSLVGRAIGGGGGVAITVLLCVAYLFALSWFVVRFSLAAPMTFSEKRVRFFGSWEATRGEGWRLYGMAWLLALIMLGCVIAYYILSLIVGLVFVGMGMAAVGGLAGGFQNLAQNPGAIGGAWPILLIYGLVSIVFGAAFTGGTQAILQAPFADAYRQLKGPDAAATFS